MSSSQAQRQERLQERLRGAGNTAFTGGFNFGFTLPQEPSPAREPAQSPPPEPSAELPPPPPPPPREPSPRQPTRKHTPPTRSSPKFSTSAVETPVQRSTRSSNRLSDVSSQQQSARSSDQQISGQKRKQADITQDETPPQRASPTASTLESSTLSRLLSSPAAETTTVARTGAVAAITPQTRGQRRRQPSPDKFLTPGDGVATRLFGMESGARSNGFTSPSRRVNAFQSLEVEPEFVDEDEDEVLLNTASLVGEILENLREEEEREENDTTMQNGQRESDSEEGEEEGEEEEEEEDAGEEDRNGEDQEVEKSPVKSAKTPGSVKRRKVMQDPPPEEEEQQEQESAEASPREPTPKPRTKAPKPPTSQPQKATISKSSKPAPPRRRETIEITVHRLSKHKSKSHPIQKQTHTSINPLDVLSQIFKEMLKKQYEKLDIPIAKLALEVFADEVEVRLLEHTDTLNTTLQAARELRRFEKVKQEKREELMALRMDLGKVEGEIDEVRRRFEKDNRESKSKHSISQRLETISAALDLRRLANPSTGPTDLEGSVDLLLRKLSTEVTSSRRRRIKLEDEADRLDDEDDDMDQIFDEEMGAGGDGLETGSTLERVRGFNRFLERAEKVVREACVSMGEGR